MLIVQVEVAILGEYRLMVPLEADVSTPVQDGTKEVVLLVPSAKKLIPHTIADVEQVVRVLAGILGQLWGEGSVKGVEYMT